MLKDNVNHYLLTLCSILLFFGHQFTTFVSRQVGIA